MDILVYIYATILASIFISSTHGAPQSQAKLHTQKIVAGVTATEGEFPYLVSIQYEDVFARTHLCGGVILTGTHVLTAAQCVAQQTATNLQVVGGELDLSVWSGAEQVVGVKTITVHPDYDSVEVTNDIAMLELSTSLILDGSTVTNVTVATQSADPDTNCVMGGWGATEETGDYAKVLQKYTVIVISDGECKTYYENDKVVSVSMLCGVGENGADFCQGDEGGPLMCSNGIGGNHLNGLASWGMGCGRGYPGIYTQVMHFTEWINALLLQ